MYSGVRTADESFLAFINRKMVEVQRYESHAREKLPETLKAKLMLKHARLSQSQLQRVHIWLEGQRSEDKIKECLPRLDSDDAITQSLGGARMESVSTSSKSMVEWSYLEQADEEVERYYLEDYDVGYDSEDTEQVWVYAQDLEGSFEEEALCEQFALFDQVHRQKQEVKMARGWQPFPKTNKGKGLTLSKGSGKFGKGKGKNKSKGQFERDHRRQGMVKLPREELIKRVKCWTCGRLGRMSKDCRSNSENNKGKGYGNGQYVEHGTEEAAWIAIPAALALADTGAVNMIMGEQQFLLFDDVLATYGLGTGGVPGVVEIAVLPGDVPTLLPVTLMKRLGATIDLPSQTVCWQSIAKSSTLFGLASGHVAINISEGLENFVQIVPDQTKYVRANHSQRHVLQLRQKLHQSAKSKQTSRTVFFDLDAEECNMQHVETILDEPFVSSSKQVGAPECECNGLGELRGATQCVPGTGTSGVRRTVHHCRSGSNNIMEATGAARHDVTSSSALDHGGDRSTRLESMPMESKKKGKNINTPQRKVTMTEILHRDRLTDGKSMWKHPAHEHWGCRHETVQAKGNAHGLWWSCAKCRARWPRESGEILA
eukprot:2413179-Amphidinium_carterae.1